MVIASSSSSAAAGAGAATGGGGAASAAHLYHANAWYRLYNLTITYRQGLAPADVRMMASSVLLAALASPLYDAGAPAGGSIHQQEVKSEKQARIATLLAFNVDPRKEVNRRRRRLRGIGTSCESAACEARSIPGESISMQPPYVRVVPGAPIGNNNADLDFDEEEEEEEEM